LWRLRAPGIERCSARAQLLCLPFYLSGAEKLAESAGYAWAGLSRACHQHPYELPPTSSELLGWLTTVDQLVAHVGAVGASVRHARD
jgi:hypothetical protein